MVDKRIYCVSLSGEEPQAIIAGFRDGQLHIIKSERLPKNLSQLKEQLPKKLTKLQSDGFIVLVDEVFPLFAQYGRPCRLSDIGQDNRPIVVSSLELYNNMMTLQAITFPLDGGSIYEISPSVVDEQRTPSGDVVYNIDWSELRPETTTLLMAIHAAMSTSLYDRVSIDAMFEALGAKKADAPHISAFRAITKGYDKTFLSQQALEERYHG
ncbi:hypothetical protein [Photobacterium leiognathi]|uniref:hypothetical protein n=1 Tax=Photobacterium leiognathi TaxID=553611 RepID=UPI0029816395|nr:hypothetical protein [Photobacterium leiognathi]